MESASGRFDAAPLAAFDDDDVVDLFDLTVFTELSDSPPSDS